MRIEDFDEAIGKHGGHDIVIAYSQVADVFTSPEPHPDSFEHKRISKASLLVWAERNNWQVEFLTQKCSPQFPNSPPVRFRKIDS